MLNNFKYFFGLAGVVAVMLSTELDAQDWPQWRGSGSDGKAVTAEFSFDHFNVKPNWKLDIGSGYSNIVAVKNQVVVIGCDGVNDYLISLDIVSGTERWRKKIAATFQGTQGSEDGASSTPCVVDDSVIVLGPNGDLVAFSIKDGTELWRKNIVKDWGAKTPLYGFGCSPFRCGKNLFVPVASENGISGVMLDPKKGSTIWNRKGDDIDYQSGYYLEKQEEVLAVDQRFLTILDAQTGEERLRFQHSSGGDLAYPQATPISDSRVLLTFGSLAALVEIDREQKQFNVAWTSRELRNCYSPPVCYENAIYGMCGTFLVCVDLETGKRIWKSRDPGARGVSLVNGTLLMLSSNGEVVFAEAGREGYREKRRSQVLQHGGYSAPVFANNRLLVRNTSGIACSSFAKSRGVSEIAKDETTEQKGAFASFLQELATSETPQRLVDQWWDQQESFPVIENNATVHFVYRGNASDVALLGDMTKDRHVADSMTQVKGTDLFYRSYSYAAKGLWHYAFLVDFEKVVCDPENDTRVPALIDLGKNPRDVGYDNHTEESVVKMPECRQPDFMTSHSSRPNGSLKTIEFQSRFRWIPKKPLQVYLPPDYAKDATVRFPVIYVLGGKEWIEHANANIAFDNLMGRACQKALVVLVPYHSGSGDRIGGATYARLVTNDVIPIVKREFRTNEESVVIGAADDAPAAIHLSTMLSAEKTPLVLFSPFMDEPDFQSIGKLDKLPQTVYLQWSRYEPLIGDENSDYRKSARQLEKLFQANESKLYGGEVQLGPGWKSWVLHLDQVLQKVLPMRD